MWIRNETAESNQLVRVLGVSVLLDTCISVRRTLEHELSRH